jgi:vitamin B12 transporter
MRFLIGSVALLASGAALAQTGDEIVVTGRGLDRPIGEAAYNTVEITRDRLTTTASGRIEDALRDIAGFQSFRRTDSRAANPTSQGATLRALGGNASSRALVLLDGVPQADPFTGYIPFSALRPERLASVRVTRGGGAGAFGAGAVAGTIELASGGPDDLAPLSAQAVGGSRGSSELSGGIAQRIGDGFVSLHGGWDRGDGYILIPPGQRGPADIPARYDAWSAALRGVAAVDARTEIQGSALIFDDRRLRGAVGTASRSYGADASVKLVGRGAWGFEALAYVQARSFRSGFVAFATDRSSVTPTLDQFNTPSTGLGAKIEIRPPVDTNANLRFGADIRHALGTTNEFFRYINGQPTRIRRAGGNTLTAGLFVEASQRFGPLTLTGGARVDHWFIRGGTLTESVVGTGAPTLDLKFADRTGARPTARFGAAYALSDALSLRAAAYSGFRVPTLNELYRPFRVGADATAANGALKLERLKGIEGGLNWQRGPATLSLTGYWNRLDDAIANVTLGAGPGIFPQVGFVAAGGVFRQRLNVDAIDVRGIEANAAFNINNFRLSASYAFADARVRASGIAAPLNGKRPSQTPSHQRSATLAYAPKTGANAAFTVRYAGPQFEDDLSVRRLPAALTMDVVAGVPIGRDLRLIARAENLFDEKVVSGVSASGIEDLGTPRTFWIGLVFGRREDARE